VTAGVAAKHHRLWMAGYVTFAADGENMPAVRELCRMQTCQLPRIYLRDPTNYLTDSLNADD